MTPPAPTVPNPQIRAEEWAALSQSFRDSLMIDTSLAALAENIDGCHWPLQGPDETPASYVTLSHPQVLTRLAARGLPPSALDHLAVILRGTLSFDASFGDMVEVAGKAEADLDPVARNLERLGIPLTFPVQLCNFTQGTLEFCQRESLGVLGDFITFSRSASRQIIIGGEFRDLLNAVAHIDEGTIARFLPYRPKTTGLHLIEALALLVRDLDAGQRQQLVLAPASLAPATRARGQRLVEHFDDQIVAMRTAFEAGTPLSRLVAPLNELTLEPAVASILRLYLHPQNDAPAATPAAPPLSPVRPNHANAAFCNASSASAWNNSRTPAGEAAHWRFASPAVDSRTARLPG